MQRIQNAYRRSGCVANVVVQTPYFGVAQRDVREKSESGPERICVWILGRRYTIIIVQYYFERRMNDGIFRQIETGID